MSKQEEKALEYQNANLNAAPYDAFLDGYQYAVEKIFKCIENQAIFGWIEDIEVDKFLEKIRKAMEE
jgi:hypothetical protein